MSLWHVRGYEHDGHWHDELERRGRVHRGAVYGESTIRNHGRGGEGGGVDQRDDGRLMSNSISKCESNS